MGLSRRLPAMLLLGLVCAGPAMAQEDLIFRKSTVWKMLTPNDKLAVYGVDDPIVEGVAFQHRPARLKASGFWVAGAVHVASSLVAGAQVDEAYLRSVGVFDKLPQWRDMVEPAAAEAA